tara:strand:+ start:118 stop:627 length:510 start_codon:yes stop_codon:yes gene_type:complete
MSSEQFLNWIIINQEYAGFAMFLIGFLEAFFISGAIWPSIILLLFAVGLNEAEISLAYICIGAGLGSWIGDTVSYYSGLFFGPKLKNLNFLKKRETLFIRGESFFNKYGWSGILIGRLIPAIRPFIPFIAGISSMKQPLFLISSIFACLIWTIALVILILGIDNIAELF